MDILKKVFPLHYAAWNVAATSISTVVNEPDQDTRNRLIKEWRVAMLSQLANAEITGAIISATIVGAFTWNSLEKLSPVADVMIRILWYSGLVLAMGAVAVGVNQSVFLTRIGCLPNANSICRRMLSRDAGQGQFVPRGDQVILWQTAVGLLEWSIHMWLAGFIVFIGDITHIAQPHQSTGDKVAAGFCCIAAGATVVTYLTSRIYLWYIAGRDLSCVI